MPNYVNRDGSFEQEAEHAPECPHCGVHAQLIPVSTPHFDLLVAAKPDRVALGFSCAACGEPRFGRAQVRAIEDDRVVLSSHIVEIERVRERFQLTYLPETVKRLFSEALACYSADLHNAFAAMCRRTAVAAVAALPEKDRHRFRDGFDDVAELGEIDQATAAALEEVLFGTAPEMIEITPGQSAVLIEVMKDVLYQCCVRKAKVKAAMNIRRYFAEEADPKVTSIRRPRGRSRRFVKNG